MQHLKDLFEEHTQQLRDMLQDTAVFHDQVLDVAQHMREAFEKGHKILIAGNGGSAAQAQHLSDELVGRYKGDRDPLPAVALTADGPVITCIVNDYGYEHVFSRQVQALGKEGDVFIGLSTSGTSKNIVEAAKMARECGMTVVALTAQKGELKDLADYAIQSNADTTERIQEMHLHAIHLLCEAFETNNLGLSTAT